MKVRSLSIGAAMVLVPLAGGHPLTAIAAVIAVSAVLLVAFARWAWCVALVVFAVLSEILTATSSLVTLTATALLLTGYLLSLDRRPLRRSDIGAVGLTVAVLAIVSIPTVPLPWLAIVGMVAAASVVGLATAEPPVRKEIRKVGAR